MPGWGMINNNSSYALRQHAYLLAALQEQVASGCRVNRASDAPADAHRIMTLREQSARLGTLARNLDTVVRDLEMSLGALDEISSSMVKVQQLLTQAANGTYGPDAMAMVGEEIDSILEQFLSLANTKSLGRYLFGGGNHGNDAAFQAERVDGRIVSVDYAGGSAEMMVSVAPGVQQPGLLRGDRIFRSDQRQTPTFLGSTGAAAGSGTSSVRGCLELEATHLATAFEAATGVTAGDSSADGDTILGEHGLTIESDGSVHTIRLDGGPAVAFDGTETDLALTGPDGDVVHVDLSAWAGYTGEVEVTATGRLSIDGGATTTDLTVFADNVAVTDGTTGRVLYVDASTIARTGAEAVRVPGTHDLFGALIHFRDVLRNAGDWTTAEQRELLAGCLTVADEVQQTIVRSQTLLGGRLQASETLAQSLTSMQDLAEQQAASLQDADLVQVATDLARTQTLYEMTLAVTSRLLTLSLLDYI